MESMRDRGYLPDEIFHKILKHLMHERIVPIDSRSSLSVDSFQPPAPPSAEDSTAICNFKYACRRFRELALEHQFAHIDTLPTWDQKSFERLQWVAYQGRPPYMKHHPRLASRVTKFSFKVPIFYPQSEEQFTRLLHDTRRLIQETARRLQRTRRSGSNTNRGDQTEADQFRDLCRLDEEEKLIVAIMIRAKDQQRMQASKWDLQVLQHALSAFTSLKHILLLRVQDQTDVQWQRYLRRHPDIVNTFRPEWTDHGMRTLGLAYLGSSCSATRFSSRFMDAQIPLPLTHGSEETLTSLAVRLATLELQFNEPQDLESKMLQLSPLFRTLFKAAVNMQTVHIEFSPGSKVSIPLEVIFHDVKWQKIRVIGVAQWRLSSEEIIDLIHRHRRTLKGLRLRDILLKKGSRWDDILRVVRSEVRTLSWMSLTRSNYAAWVDAHRPIGSLVDDSDDESSDEEEMDDQNSPAGTEIPSDEELGDEAEEEDSEGDDSTNDSNEDEDNDDSDSDVGAAVYDTSMEEHIDRPPIPLQCHCNRRYEITEDLGDDGIEVTKDQRKYWQQWVVGRCRIHDPQAS